MAGPAQRDSMTPRIETDIDRLHHELRNPVLCLKNCLKATLTCLSQNDIERAKIWLNDCFSQMERIEAAIKPREKKDE